MQAAETVSLRSVARTYAHADDRRAWIELGVTLALYFVGLGVGLATLGTWVITVPAVLLTAAMGLRVYMIQHDCLHGSFFTSRQTNDIAGTLLSAIAMTPYRATRHIHNLHHTHVSDLDRRDTFEIKVMTLKEWEAATPLQRLFYRVYRSPVTLIVIGPFILYAVLRRMPLYGFKTGAWDLVVHNALLAALLFAIWSLGGWAGLGIWIASVYLACAFGALIPYVVHNFEVIHWGTKPELDFETAALKGSAVLDWGRLFDLVTLNIGYHDLHHLNARIPGYKLKAAHEDLEARGLLKSECIGFFDGLRCLRWKLFDEEQDRMIAFPKARSTQLAPAE